MMSNAVKNFDIPGTNSNVLIIHNYFNNLIKLFLDPYLAKFLDFSAKLFFSCIYV